MDYRVSQYSVSRKEKTLPVHVRSSPCISTFQQRLKSFLFQQLFPNVII